MEVILPVTRVDEQSEVFHAMADPTRRALLDQLRAAPGRSLAELCVGLQMTRQSVSKHLAVLEGANLVTSVRRGRQKLHYLNAAPIQKISERFIADYELARVQTLARLQHVLEDRLMDRPAFVYTTYIRTTPEQLWRGLTEPEFTRAYWDCSFETTWFSGMTYVLEDGGGRIADPGQIILESRPYERLAYTWHTFTPEWAKFHGVSDDVFNAYAAEPRSKVAFDLVQEGDLVKLTVTHDDFEEGSQVLKAVTDGWPKVLGGLKSLLETGAVA